ncbi:MAG: LysE family translocator [Pseudomonadota bacterium]
MTIEWYQLLLYAGAYFVMVVSPGPFVAAIAARSAAFGVRSGFSMAIGAYLAEKIWILTAIFGLALIAAHYGDILIVLKFVGAAWLIWLGAKLIFGRSGVMRDDPTLRPIPFWQGVATGWLINMGNPKAALFFMALFPGFFDVSVMTWVDALVIIAVSTPIGLGSDMAYAWAADRARRLLSNARTARRIDQATGGVLCGAGAAIAAS